MIAAVIIASLGGSTSSKRPARPLRLADPPQYAAHVADCTQVLEKLPIKLGRLNPRAVFTTAGTPSIVAWGNPAVILRCGVDKPKALHPGSSTKLVPGGSLSGPFFAVTSADGSNVWTSVDRAAYISVTIPSAYSGGNVMPPLSRAIGAALPQVCSPTPAAGVPTSKLCAERP